MTVLDAIVGAWRLAAYGFARDEWLPTDARANRLGIAGHLLGGGDAPLRAASGLSLTIGPRGRFSQTDTDAFDGYVYDGEGVETTRGGSFAGSLQPVGTRAYLLADGVPRNAAPAGRWLETLLLRYDDGDTIVCDWVEPRGEELLRVISVVTDQLYPSRATLRYRREG